MKLAALTLTSALLFSGSVKGADLQGREGLDELPIPQDIIDLPGDPYEEPNQNQPFVAPSVYIQYHYWFNDGECDGEARPCWSHWRWWSSQDNPNRVHEEDIAFREITSPGYPLIGPYDSSNPEVMRWHIRLAKEAGVRGFFASAYSFAEGEEQAFREGLATLLDVAHEESFKIGVELWQPRHDRESIDEWKNEVKYIYDNMTDHPAFLRILNKPALWFNFYAQWMSNGELLEFLDSRHSFWMVSGGLSTNALRNLNEQTNWSDVQALVTYAHPTSKGWKKNSNFRRDLNRNIADLPRIAHGYVGYDEQRLGSEENRSDRYGVRAGGETTRLLVDAASRANGMLVIESWNDWIEFTAIEPGWDLAWTRDLDRDTWAFQDDNHKPLRVLAEALGKEYENVVPPCEIVDPILLSYDKIQCE